jgi:O-antigen ligase/Tfp pilus assembly protein PilF
MPKKPTKKISKPASRNLEGDAGGYIKSTALWGVCLLLLATPFFRGLFFAPEQQKALFFATIIFWTVWLWKRQRRDGRFLSHPLDYLALALPAVYLLSSFNAANTGLAVDEIVKTTLYFLVYWSVANLVTAENDALRIMKFVCLAGLLVSLAGQGAATGVVNIKDGFVSGRIYSTFQYPNALASYLMTAIFLSLYIWVRDDAYSLADLLGLNKKGLPGILVFNLHRYIYIICTYIAFVVFVGARSNGGFLVLVLALAVYFAGLPGGRRIPAAFHLIMTGGPAIPCAVLFIKSAVSGRPAQAWLWVLAGALAVILLQRLYDSLEKRGFPELISRKKIIVPAFAAIIVFSLLAAGLAYLSSHGQVVAGALEQFRMRNAVERIYFYRDALKMAAERPLLGWGGGGWQEAYRMYQGYLYNSTQVHGHYFQIAVETGVTGLLVILSAWAVFLCLTYSNLKNSRGDPGRRMLLWTAFISAVALGAHAVIDFDLSLSALTLVLWSMFGVMRAFGPGAGLKEPSAGVKAAKRLQPAFIAASVFCLGLISITGCLITASGSFSDSVARLKAGDLPGATVLMERAAFYNPFNPEYNAGLSSLYSQQGKLEQAAGQAEKALSKSKFSSPLYTSLAGLYLNLNRPGEAVAMSEKAVKLAPYQDTWYNFLARTYFTAGYNLMAQGKNGEAGEFLIKATQVNERMEKQAAKLGPLEKRLWTVAPMLAPSAYTLLYSGASLCMLGEYGRAEPLLEKVSGDNMARAESLLWLSLAAQRRGNQAKSAELLAQAQALVPNADKQFPYIFNMIKK